MLGGATGLILFLINIFILILIVRAILSWFPGTMYTEFGRIVLMATEWYLAPIRRVIPPAGGLDISFLVGIVILYALSIFLGSGNIISALITVIGYALVFIIILLLVRIFFGFFRMDPGHPITQMVMQSTEIFARPFRGFFPKPRYSAYSSYGASHSFDWAPVAAFAVVLVAYILLMNISRLIG